MRMWMAALGLLALSACASEAPVCGGVFALDSAVDRELAEGVRDDWNTWVGREVVRFEPGAQCRLVMGPVEGTHSGWWDPAEGTITLDPSARDPARSLRHEIGHALGMGHVRGPAVMAERLAESSDWFTWTDEAEAKRVGLKR
jgi:hypothetical protein